MEGVLVSAKKADSTVTVTRRERRAGPIRLPSEQTGAGSIRAPRPCCRLRSGGPGADRHCGGANRDGQSHAEPRERLVGPADECGMGFEHAGHRRPEGPPAHVHRVPYPGTHRQVATRRGRVGGVLQRMGGLHEFGLPAPHPETAGSLAARAAWRGASAIAGAVRPVPQHGQSERQGHVVVFAEDLPAAQGQGHAGHRHRVRPSAGDNRAARRRRRRAGDRVVFEFRRADDRKARSEDGRRHRISHPDVETKLSDREPGTAVRSRRQPVAGPDEPGRAREIRSEDQHDPDLESATRSGTTTRRRSTWFIRNAPRSMGRSGWRTMATR